MYVNIYKNKQGSIKGNVLSFLAGTLFSLLFWSTNMKFFLSCIWRKSTIWSIPTLSRISSIWCVQHIRRLLMSLTQASIHRMGTTCNDPWCDYYVPAKVHHWDISSGFDTDWRILYKGWWWWWELFVFVVFFVVESWNTVSWRNWMVSTFSFSSSFFLSFGLLYEAPPSGVWFMTSRFFLISRNHERKKKSHFHEMGSYMVHH